MPIDAEDLRALLPPTDPAPGCELVGGGTADGLRFAGPALTGDATAARFLECELAGCDLGGVGFDRARLTSCLLTDVRSAAWSLLDATLLDVVVDVGRFGAVTAHGSGLTRVRLGDLKVDYLGLRNATVVDVTLAGCTVGELDLAGADLRVLVLTDCTIASLVLDGGRCRSVDLRGARVTRLDGVAGLRECTIDAAQLVGWAPQLAAELGITVR